MLYILNGINDFSKESSINSILDKLPDYQTQRIIISSLSNTNTIQDELEDLVINLSMDGLFSSEFCGIVSLPEPPKKKINSKKNTKSSNDNIFYDLLNLANKYCSQAKQLIIHLPSKLSDSQKNDILNICNEIKVNFIDLTYVSTFEEAYKFCSDTLDESKLIFKSQSDRELFIKELCNLARYTTNKNGQLEDLTIFTREKDIVYNQHLIYSSIVVVFLWNITRNTEIVFEEVKPLLLPSIHKQQIYTLVENIMKCSTKKEIITCINDIFSTLTKTEIFSLLTIIKSCMWDYISFLNGSKPTRNCRLIINGNLKFKEPLVFYNKLSSLRDNVTLDDSSYKNDLILLLLEQF